MSQENVSQLLQKAQQALQVGDKKTASTLINQILAVDFTNPQVWQFLHSMLAKDVPLETFKLQFTQKYYPSKLNLLVQAQNDNVPIPATMPISTQPRLTKKCPYCAEEILIDATVCRFCGRDLTKEHPQAIAEKRKELTTKLIGLEKNLASNERALQEWQQVAQQESRGVTQSEIVFLIGILLTPVVVGIFLIIVSGLAYFTHKGKRDNAENNQTTIRSNIENLRKMIAEAKIELATLG